MPRISKGVSKYVAGGASARRGARAGAAAKVGRAAKVSVKRNPVPASVKAFVKRAIHADIEKKSCLIVSGTSMSYDKITNVQDNAAVKSINASIQDSDYQRVLPSLAPGMNAGQRIGQEVRPLKLRMRGQIAINGGVSGSDILDVRMIVAQRKDVFQYYEYAELDNTSASLLDMAQWGPTQYKGMQMDNTLPVNTKLWKVYADHVYKVRKGNGNTDGATTNGNQTFVDGKQVQYFDIEIKCPAKLKWDEGDNGGDPLNFAPVVMFGYSQPDGYAAAPDFLNHHVVVMWTAELVYEDA